MRSLATQDWPPIATESADLVAVPLARRSGAARFYRPQLDVLRFFAFLSVFLYHGLPGLVPLRHSGLLARVAAWEVAVKEAGRFGVCLFFVLSAYLITELLCRERARTGTIRVASFYSRRILRIWPLYFTFLFFGVLLGLLFRDYRLEESRLWAFLLLAGNWYVVQAGCSANPIAPLWSISVEEQFYLIWPWIARLGGQNLIGLVCLLLLPLSSFFLSALCRGGGEADRTIWLNSFVQFQFFAAGALLALAMRGRVPRPRSAVKIAMLPAGLASWLCADGVFHVNVDGTRTSPASMVAGYALVAIGCLCFMGSFLALSERWLPKSLIYLGKISYGLYVFHMLSLKISWALFWPADAQRAAVHTAVGLSLLVARAGLVLLFGLAVTIALAALSYRFLERPFLDLKQRFTVVPSRMA